MAGMPPRHAEIVGDALVDAETWGKASHGLIRLPAYAERVRRGGIGVADPRVVEDNGNAVVVDAMGGPGQVAALVATDLAVERAQVSGVSVIAVRNSNHAGHLGYFSRHGAERGMVCGCMSNASPRLSPGAGSRPMFGNNPWSVALPSHDAPIVVDMANSRVAAGKIRAAKAAGRSIPKGWALDVDGKPTTDPAAALAGSLLPMGGYKGLSISLLVSVLTAGLAGGELESNVRPVDDVATPQAMSQLVWALDPSLFSGRDTLLALASTVATRIDAALGDVRVPGTNRSGLRLVEGKEVVILDDSTWQRVEPQFRGLQSRTGAPVPELVSLEG